MKGLVDFLNGHIKAIVGGLVAAYSVYLVVSPDGVTSGEWIQIVMAALAGAGLTFAIPNTGPFAPKNPPPPPTE